jgi:hypothetical protein
MKGYSCCPGNPGCRHHRVAGEILIYGRHTIAVIVIVAIVGDTDPVGIIGRIAVAIHILVGGRDAIVIIVTVR